MNLGKTKIRFYTLVISMIFLVIASLGILVFDKFWGSESKAASNWSNTWTVNQWRNLNIHVTYFDGDANVSLGPSKWNVTGSVDGQNYSETWEVGQWREGRTACAVRSSYPGTPYCNWWEYSFSNGNYLAPSGGGLNVYYGGTQTVFTSGLYTALTGMDTGNGITITGVHYSMPTSWTVTGQFN